jgi:hypothetical protein
MGERHPRQHQEQPFGCQKKNTTSLFLLDFHGKKVTAIFIYLVSAKT